MNCHLAWTNIIFLSVTIFLFKKNLLRGLSLSHTLSQFLSMIKKLNYFFLKDAAFVFFNFLSHTG